MKQIEDNLEEILEVLDGDGVPNIEWVRNKIADTLKQVKNNGVLDDVSCCECSDNFSTPEVELNKCFSCGKKLHCN